MTLWPYIFLLSAFSIFLKDPAILKIIAIFGYFQSSSPNSSIHQNSNSRHDKTRQKKSDMKQIIVKLSNVILHISDNMCLCECYPNCLLTNKVDRNIHKNHAVSRKYAVANMWSPQKWYLSWYEAIMRGLSRLVCQKCDKIPQLFLGSA